MLTIAEIARRYDLPESTARYYCKRFRAFLPNVGEGKRRRFLPEALPVFEALLKAMADSKSASSVEAALEAQFPRIGAQAKKPSPGQFSAQGGRLEELLERQTKALENISHKLDSLFEQQQSPLNTGEGHLENRLKEMESRLLDMQQTLRQELKNLGSMQDQAERIHQQDIEQLRKWLNHLAREQAKERESG